MKSKILSLLLMLPILGLLGSCSKDEIVFDHELPQFETRADAILLEVIMPVGTLADDQIYIVGDFNGGEEEALADPRWMLEKAPNGNVKWGIYLFPEDFKDGKSLEDGYYFVNKQQGPERSAKNLEVVHTDNPGLGGWCNVWVDCWKSKFDTPVEPDEVEHDGYAVFVLNKTDWPNDAVSLYMWGDVNNLNGDWPGMKATGSVTIGGDDYIYFDMGAANTGLSENLIFSNDGANQKADFAFTIDRDIYLELSDDGVKEIEPASSVKHDGFAVFVYNRTDWANDALSLYMWGDVNNLNGDWPGMKATGTQKVKGLEYVYFDFGAANTGLAENLIFSNDGANQKADFAFTIERDLYLELTDAGVAEIDPANYNPEGGVEPPVEPTPTTQKYTLYVENKTTWDAYALYAWGASEIFGGWPGKVADAQETIAGVVFDKFEVECVPGAEEHLIFNNNNGGIQYDGPVINIDRDFYFTITDTECVEISRPEPAMQNYTIYVDNQTGWDAFTIYAWGASELFGGWPGQAADGKETVNGVEYLTWHITVPEGAEYNLIFNNAGGGTQYDAATISATRDFYFIANPLSCDEVNKQSDLMRYFR